MRLRGSTDFELPLALLREAVAQSDLLPGVYARYRPLLADGLQFFLRRLSPGRLRALLAEQASLPARASTAGRVVKLLRHSPALHKLGQVVARDHRLQPAFRKHLQELESMAPRLSTAEVVPLLNRALPHWRHTGVQLGPEPLAEGSVAIIMPFVWPFHSGAAALEGPAHAETVDAQGNQPAPPTGRPGVFKLLKPGVQRLLQEDLDILGSLGGFLDNDCARYHLPQLDYRETFATIRRLLLHEIRLDEEQRHLAEAGHLYRGMEWVAIPALFPFCSRQVTAMERLSGAKLEEGSLRAPLPRRAAARIVAEALVAGPLFSPRAAALFHADPHAGNLLLSPEGRVGILDWSLAGRLRKAEREALLQLLLGGVQQNVERMAGAIAELARRQPQPAALETVLREGLRELRWGGSPGLAWLARLLDQLVGRAGLRLPGNLLLFRKALLTLEGVLADLTRTNAQAAWTLLDQAVLGAFLAQWTREWPRRACAPFHTRSFGTHLSNTDLLGLLYSGPAALSRWWTETGLDLVQAASRVIISTTRSSFCGAASEKAR
jgi:ubiquinone biosynthesis protein